MKIDKEKLMKHLNTIVIIDKIKYVVLEYVAHKKDHEGVVVIIDGVKYILRRA